MKKIVAAVILCGILALGGLNASAAKTTFVTEFFGTLPDKAETTSACYVLPVTAPGYSLATKVDGYGFSGAWRLSYEGNHSREELEGVTNGIYPHIRTKGLSQITGLDTGALLSIRAKIAFETLNNPKFFDVGLLKNGETGTGTYFTPGKDNMLKIHSNGDVSVFGVVRNTIIPMTGKFYDVNIAITVGAAVNAGDAADIPNTITVIIDNKTIVKDLAFDVDADAEGMDKMTGLRHFRYGFKLGKLDAEGKMAPEGALLDNLYIESFTESTAPTVPNFTVASVDDSVKIEDTYISLSDPNMTVAEFLAAVPFVSGQGYSNLRYFDHETYTEHATNTPGIASKKIAKGYLRVNNNTGPGLFFFPILLTSELSDLLVADVKTEQADEGTPESACYEAYTYKNPDLRPLLVIGAYEDGQLVGVSVSRGNAGRSLLQAETPYAQGRTYKTFLWDANSAAPLWETAH